jgi:hypothetical protein
VKADPRCFAKTTQAVDQGWALYHRLNPAQRVADHHRVSAHRAELTAAAGRRVAFRRDDAAILAPKLIKARARVIGDDRVRVSLCVDRREAMLLADPGTYRGTVSIIDPRVTRTDIPLEVDAADPKWTFSLFLVLVAVVAGSWVTWIIKEQKADSYGFRPREWFIWSGTAIGIICLVAGASAGVATYQATYLSRSTWGSSVNDYVTLLTGCFVAFMGVTTSLHVAGMAQQASHAKRAPGHASGAQAEPGTGQAGDGGQD